MCIRDRINDLRALKDSSQDAATIRRKMDELQQAASKLGEQMYGQQPGAAPGTPGPHVGPGYTPPSDSGPAPEQGPDVVDGEFREV